MKKTVFSTNDAVTTGHLQSKKIFKKNLDTHFTSFTKMYYKWITVLNVKCKNIKLPENNTGENLRYGNNFLIQHQRSIKETTDK